MLSVSRQLYVWPRRTFAPRVLLFVGPIALYLLLQIYSDGNKDTTVSVSVTRKSHSAGNRVFVLPPAVLTVIERLCHRTTVHVPAIQQILGQDFFHLSYPYPGRIPTPRNLVFPSRFAVARHPRVGKKTSGINDVERFAMFVRARVINPRFYHPLCPPHHGPSRTGGTTGVSPGMAD